MKLCIKVTGSLLRPNGKSEISYECEDNITVKGLLKRLKFSEVHIPFVRATINGILRNQNHVLHNLSLIHI